MFKGLTAIGVSRKFMFVEYQAQIDAYKTAFSALEGNLNEILKPLIVLDDPSASLLQASSAQAELEQLKGAQNEAEKKSAQLTASTEELERLRSDNEKLKQAVERSTTEKGQNLTELEAMKSDLASATNLYEKGSPLQHMIHILELTSWRRSGTCSLIE